MAIELTDDGTLDTVLRCSECGEEFRGNFDPGIDEDGYSYDDYVSEFIADVEMDHVCGEEE